METFENRFSKIRVVYENVVANEMGWRRGVSHGFDDTLTRKHKHEL